MGSEPRFRIVGNASEDVKAQKLGELQRAFHHHADSIPPVLKEEMARLEYPKSPKELALIDFANRETNAQMKAAGMEPFDVPVVNHHIIPPDLFEKIEGEVRIAVTNQHAQAVLYNAVECRRSILFFGTVALHETDHLKEFRAEQIDKADRNMELYRGGLMVVSRRKGVGGQRYKNFQGLNEAVKTAQDKMLFGKMLDLPELEIDKKEWMSEDAVARRRALAEKRNLPLDEIIWVAEDGQSYEVFGYRPQRLVVQYICEQMAQALPSKYASPDAVLTVFRRARYTGELSAVATPFEDTFGEGSLRVLGMMGMDRNSISQTDKTLRKMRRMKIMALESSKNSIQ